MGQATVRHSHRATVYDARNASACQRRRVSAPGRAKVTGYVPWHIMGYLEAWDFLGYHGKEAARFQATRLQPKDCDNCDAEEHRMKPTRLGVIWIN